MANIPTFSDLENYRYNSFTNTITPKQIGYGANPTEDRTISNSAPYIILLHEAPQLNIPSTTSITDNTTSTILEEVSKTTTPGNNQYRVNYDERGLGQVEFNANQKGHSISAKYYGEGSNNKVENYQSTANAIQVNIESIGSLYVTGGNVTLNESIIFGQTIPLTNLGAIAGLAASKWYFTVIREDTSVVSLQRLSTLVPTTPAVWTPSLVNNQLDMLPFYDITVNYPRYEIGGNGYKILYVFKINAVPDDIEPGLTIKIKNKPYSFVKMHNDVVQIISTGIDAYVSFPTIEIDALSEISGAAAARIYTAKDSSNIDYNFETTSELQASGAQGFFSLYLNGAIDKELQVQTGSTLNQFPFSMSNAYSITINDILELKSRRVGNNNQLNPGSKAKGTSMFIMSRGE